MIKVVKTLYDKNLHVKTVIEKRKVLGLRKTVQIIHYAIGHNTIQTWGSILGVKGSETLISEYNKPIMRRTVITHNRIE